MPELFAKAANNFMESSPHCKRKLAYWLALTCIAVAGDLSISSTFTLRPALPQTATGETLLPERDRLYEEGLRLRQAGQLEKALDMFQQALQAFEETEGALSDSDRQRQVDVLNQIGNVYLDLEKYDLASEYYAQAIEINQTSQSVAESESDGQAIQPNVARPINLQLPDIAASGVVSSGATRGTILSGYGLMAVLPETNFGFTALDYPKILVSVSEPLDGATVEFRVAEQSPDSSPGQIYETTRLLTLPTAGIFGIDFATLDNMPPLQMGKRYIWQVSLVKNPNRPSQNLVIAGEVERVNRIEADNATDYSPTDMVYAYAEAGLWYDAIAALYTLEQQDEAFNGLWQEILRIAELDELINEPLLGDWSDFSVAEAHEEEAQSTEESNSQTTGDGYRPSADIGPPSSPIPGGTR